MSVHSESGSVSAAARAAVLAEMREKHGFVRPGAGKTAAGKWSKGMLDAKRGEIVARLREELGESATGVSDEASYEKGAAPFVPKNRELLDLFRVKFESIGFGWTAVQNPVKNRKGEVVRLANSVSYVNYPTIGGAFLTLADMALTPIELCDQFKGSARRVVGESRVEVATMSGTGIGYKGVQGVSWHVLPRAFPLPLSLEEMVLHVAAAVFLLYDAVHALWDEDVRLRTLLEHKVPGRIPRLVDRTQQVRILRPDMVIVEDKDGLRVVVTELESCPAGHGMMVAMQAGYSMPGDMVDVFVRYLAGRPYTVIATSEWLEYVFDQAVFCAALRKRGVDARIIFDCPLTELGTIAKRWEAPKGVKISSWDTDVMARLAALGFDGFIYGVESPDELRGLTGVLFRFGYFDNFPRVCEVLAELGGRSNVEVMNPASFFLESKALMAAAKLPSVRAWITAHDPGAVVVLDRCLAETRVLGVSDTHEFLDDRGYWVSKFAAWDGKNQSWGARSLVVGAQTSGDVWERTLDERVVFDHPVVMQHVINSARWDVDFLDGTGARQTLLGGRTRLTPFLVRDQNGRAQHAGSMITLRADTYRVHGAMDAVEAPVVYTNTEEK